MGSEIFICRAVPASRIRRPSREGKCLEAGVIEPIPAIDEWRNYVGLIAAPSDQTPLAEYILSSMVPWGSVGWGLAEVRVVVISPNNIGCEHQLHDL
jgi:hypothetical protein